MNAEILRRAHTARPFIPFTIHLTEGRQFLIPHPVLLSVSRTGRGAVVFTEGDDFHDLDLLLATGIHVHSPPTPAGPPHGSANGA